MEQPQPLAGETKHTIAILACTIAWRDKLLDHAVSAARKIGFDGLEVWGREPHTPDKFDETRLRAARKMIELSGLKVAVLSSYLRFGMTRNDSSAVQIGDTLHIAHSLKTPVVRVWASDVASRAATPAVWKQTISEARVAAEHAAKLEITLVMEMHPGTLADTAQSALKMIHEVDHPAFRINYQVNSFNDGQSPEERLEMVLPWVRHMHAQNYDQLTLHDLDAPRRVPLASGIANYPRLIGILRQAGYQGSISVEFAYDESVKGKQVALEDDLRFLRALCQ